MTHGHQTLSAKPDRVACHRFMASVGPSTGAFAPKLVKRPWATLCMARASVIRFWWLSCERHWGTRGYAGGSEGRVRWRTSGGERTEIRPMPAQSPAWPAAALGGSQPRCAPACGLAKVQKPMAMKPPIVAPARC